MSFASLSRTPSVTVTLIDEKSPIASADCVYGKYVNTKFLVVLIVNIRTKATNPFLILVKYLLYSISSPVKILYTATAIINTQAKPAKYPK